MLRKTIACLLIVTHLANVGCSNLPAPFPGVVEDVFPGVAQDVASDLAIRQVAAIWKDDIPIERTEHTFYPTVERLPGAEFTPTPLPSNLEDNTPIAPGDYEIPVHFYCTGHYMRNGSGYRYRLAKLEGRFSEALTQLYVRASQAGISSSTMQVLSWSLQAGVAYEDLGSLERALVDRLIPEYRAQMQLGFTEKLMRDWDTWSSRMPVPSFNETLAKMGDVGAYIRTLMDARQEIINKDYNYHALASVFVTESDAPVPMDPEKTPWGRIHDRIFMRFIAPQGALHDGAIQIRILDGYSQSPQAPHTTGVTETRPNHGADACALSDSLDCHQSTFDESQKLSWSRFVRAAFADSAESDNLVPTTIVAPAIPRVLRISSTGAAPAISRLLLLRIPLTGAILWGAVIVLLLAVIAVSYEAQSLTATVNKPSSGSKPSQQPLPIPTPVPIPVPPAAEAAEEAAKEELRQKIAECEAIWAEYKALVRCSSCRANESSAERKTKMACISATLAGRKRYLSKKCDDVLPGSIARGPGVAQRGHEIQAGQLENMLAKCFSLPTT